MIQPPFERAATLRALPAIRHGFFGRRCGNGAAAAGLNVSENFANDPNEVGHNTRLAMTAAGAGALPLARVRQVHSNRVVTLTEPPKNDERPEADGMVTALPNIALGVLTADCAPVLFADTNAGIIGACHAGWQGAVDGVLTNTIEAMMALGANPSNMVAAIGPTISGVNYEVGSQFAEALAARNERALAFVSIPPEGDKEHFDLPAFILSEVQRAGIASAENLQSCTYALPVRYFSHRHATHFGGEQGRQISLIARIER